MSLTETFQKIRDDFLSQFAKKEVTTMPTVDEILAEIDSIQTAFDTFKTSVATAISTLQSEIGTGTVDLTGVKTSLDTLLADVQGSTVPTV